MTSWSRISDVSRKFIYHELFWSRSVNLKVKIKIKISAADFTDQEVHVVFTNDP